MFKIIAFSLLFPLSQASVLSVAKGSSYCLRRTNQLSHSRQYDPISQHCDSDITVSHCVPMEQHSRNAGVSQHQTPGIGVSLSTAVHLALALPFWGNVVYLFSTPKKATLETLLLLAFLELSQNFIIPFSFFFLKQFSNGNGQSTAFQEHVTHGLGTPRHPRILLFCARDNPMLF